MHFHFITVQNMTRFLIGAAISSPSLYGQWKRESNASLGEQGHKLASQLFRAEYGVENGTLLSCRDIVQWNFFAIALVYTKHYFRHLVAQQRQLGNLGEPFKVSKSVKTPYLPGE